MRKKLIVFIGLLIAPALWAQADGYWDGMRTTSEQLVLAAGEKKIIQTADFPQGTTEFVLRVTVLDTDQKLGNSLASVLRAIPDPSGISQGSAGAITLLSSVSGDDKCKVALFTTREKAEKYAKTGQAKDACWVQSTPINKLAKLLTPTNAPCLKTVPLNMFLLIESDNLVLREKVAIEIVPWVDNKVRTGWTINNRKMILNTCKVSDVAKNLSDPDFYCACVSDRIQKKMSFAEYDKLLVAEKKALWQQESEFCVNNTNADKSLMEATRKKALALMDKDKYAEAITLLQKDMMDDSKMTSYDFTLLGRCFILTKQFQKAVQILRVAENKDAADLYAQLNLAHALMFSGEVGLCKEIHKKYKTQNINATTPWMVQFDADLELFKKKGLPTEYFGRIQRAVH